MQKPGAAHRLTLLTIACVPLLLLARSAAATTIEPLADAHLVDRAPLVVDATVEANLGVSGSRPSTDWLVGVRRVLKGSLDTGRIVVRLPGGERPDGIALHIYGTPKLQAGLDAILFLRPRPDGTYGIADFPQGAFLAARSSRRTLALRDFSEVRVVNAGRSGDRDAIRDFARFADWIEDRAGGVRRLPDYVVQPTRSELSTIVAPFTLFTTNGLNLRWFQFDSGQAVAWRTHTTPMPGLAGGGSTEFQRALAVWNNEPTTPVRYTYAGSTSATGGLDRYDSVNSILWTDLNNEMAGAFVCGQGGTLAIGGPWSDSSRTGSFNGKTYIRIVGADIVVNDGVECKKSTSPNFSKMIEELTAHELGHTLGIDHSSENQRETNSVLKQALMYAYIHDDGRGGVLNSDDVAALQSLYRKGGSAPPPSSPPPTGPAGCPAGTLCLVSNRFEVTATWQNQFNNTSGNAGAVQSTDLTGFFHFTTDRNAYEVMVKMVDYDGKFLLFYTELTKVNFVMTVRDKVTGKVKTYRNTAGNCGGIDLDFLNGAALQPGSGATQVRDLGTPRPPRGSCKSAAGTLCLLQNRYSVEVPFWRNQFDGKTGSGTARALNPLAGGFHFSADPRDLEIVFMLNQYPDKVLAFYGAVNVFEYRVVLTDETTGRALEFYNPPGAYCGGFVNGVP